MADSVIGIRRPPCPLSVPLKALTDHTLLVRVSFERDVDSHLRRPAGLTQYFSKTAIAACAEGFQKISGIRLCATSCICLFPGTAGRRPATLSSSCTSDVETTCGSSFQTASEVIRILLLILTAVIIMFMMDVPLALISFAFIPVIILIPSFSISGFPASSGKRMRRRGSLWLQFRKTRHPDCPRFRHGNEKR